KSDVRCVGESQTRSFCYIWVCCVAQCIIQILTEIYLYSSLEGDQEDQKKRSWHVDFRPRYGRRRGSEAGDALVSTVLSPSAARQAQDFCEIGRIYLLGGSQDSPMFLVPSILQFCSLISTCSRNCTSSVFNSKHRQRREQN
ncbi:unnamed protein product, partial [Musa hybrid cultivar]